MRLRLRSDFALCEFFRVFGICLKRRGWKGFSKMFRLINFKLLNQLNLRARLSNRISCEKDLNRVSVRRFNVRYSLNRI